ncbi:copper chaperone for superoxide dismutase [Microplitis demolitor]|uniref:copper chaperone for superoxide dismutase n=1 Tax=Microplitis demolitor TaxID=69319 RepID=UPI000440021D|nr:copper chaperone for superoxide dismutase [Microplitis demolitor]
MASKIEFAVNMTCEKCVDAIKNCLSDNKDIQKVDISLDRGTVLVETKLPYTIIQEKIESSGKRAVLKGFGDNSSAVSMIGGTSGFSKNKLIQGVVRFIETQKGCIVDGTIDGLDPGDHGLHIHECGDISNGCESVGQHFNPYNCSHGGLEDDISNRHMGDLGNITADTAGRALFRFQNNDLKVTDIIGRSLVVTENADDLGRGQNSNSKIDGNSGLKIACGIIARSCGIFENTKKICSCDGKTLWDERDELKKKYTQLLDFKNINLDEKR